MPFPLPGTLGALTEAGFHARLREILPAGRTGPLPLGDDCAALPGHGRRVLLLTTDAVGEGTHFPPDSPPRLVGQLVANVNLSDLAAKGGQPLGLLSALLLPPETETRWAEEVTRGMEEVAGACGAHLLGGDTKRGVRRTIVAMAVGEGERGHLMPRSGARPGDLLAVTGTVGRGGAAYLSWARHLVDRKKAIRRLLSITPRLPEGRALRMHARAALDTSDGLARSLRLLATASGVSALVRAGSLPLDSRAERVASSLHLSRLEVALLGGDYEILAAVPPEEKEGAQRSVRKAGGRLTFIGKVGRGPRGACLLESGGKTGPLPEIGWDAFAVGRGRQAG